MSGPKIALALAAVLLAGCSALPGTGPTTSQIVDNASSAEAPQLSYELVPVSSAAVDLLRHRSDASLAGRFGDSAPTDASVIGTGDVLSVTIYEAGAGGLFTAGAVEAGGASTGARSATIPPQAVSSNGTITVPYAGAITAAGRTPQQVQAAIEAELEGVAIEPQVIVTVTDPVFSTVTVIGEVTGGGRVPLSLRGDRILDAIAQAGGLSAAAYETFVTLSRGNSTARVPMQTIINDPSENVRLRPGDVISVTRDPQTFVALGATGANATLPFDAAELSVNEAIGRVGGLLDLRADPTGVFIFRFESRAILQRLNPESPLLQLPGDRFPVVYQLNLRDPNGLFLAQEFKLADGDLVYVSNATLNELQKFLSLVAAVVQPINTAASLANTLQ